MDDLQAAIAKAELAVSITPQIHPNRAERLNNLAKTLSNQYNRTGNYDALQAAISKAKLAVFGTPFMHPARARHLNDFGMMLFD